MDKTRWMCCDCVALDMKMSFAMAHSDRLKHRVILQTPEAKLEREDMTRVTQRVESKFRNHILDGQQHSEECHCYACVQLLLDALVEKSDRITREMLGE